MAKAQKKQEDTDAATPVVAETLKSVTPAPAGSLRQQLRSQILSKRRGKFEVIEFHGATIEVRQPSLGAVLNLQEASDRGIGIARMIVGYCYVPGTDELVFEEHDIPDILKMPMDEGMIALNGAINKMTGVKVEEEIKNSDETQADD